jgi:hypothetical protein
MFSYWYWSMPVLCEFHFHISVIIMCSSFGFRVNIVRVLRSIENSVIQLFCLNMVKWTAKKEDFDAKNNKYVTSWSFCGIEIQNGICVMSKWLSYQYRLNLFSLSPIAFMIFTQKMFFKNFKCHLFQSLGERNSLANPGLLSDCTNYFSMPIRRKRSSPTSDDPRNKKPKVSTWYDNFPSNFFFLFSFLKMILLLSCNWWKVLRQF